MGTDVGVETPVYRRGSDPGMVFSARTRGPMGSDVGVQPPVPPPLGPVSGPLCVALHVSNRYARHIVHARHSVVARARRIIIMGCKDKVTCGNLYYPSHVVLYAAVAAILGR